MTSISQSIVKVNISIYSHINYFFNKFVTVKNTKSRIISLFIEKSKCPIATQLETYLHCNFWLKNLLRGQKFNEKGVVGSIKLEICPKNFSKFILLPKIKLLECALLLHLRHKVNCRYVFVQITSCIGPIKTKISRKTQKECIFNFQKFVVYQIA